MLHPMMGFVRPEYFSCFSCIVLESSDESEGDTSTPYQMNEDDEELQTFDDPGVDDTNEGQTQTVLNEVRSIP